MVASRLVSCCPSAVTPASHAASTVGPMPLMMPSASAPSPAQSTMHGLPLAQSVASSMQCQGVVNASSSLMTASTTLPISSLMPRWPKVSANGVGGGVPPVTLALNGATWTVMAGIVWPLHWPVSPGLLESVVATSNRAHSGGSSGLPAIWPLQSGSQ